MSGTLVSSITMAIIIHFAIIVSITVTLDSFAISGDI
jgi:hypothetical protein